MRGDLRLDLVDDAFVVVGRAELEQLRRVSHVFAQRLDPAELLDRRCALAHQGLRLLLIVPELGSRR